MRHALDDEPARPQVAHLRQPRPVERRVVVAAHRGCDGRGGRLGRGACRLGQPGQRLHLRHAMARHAQRPARVQCKVEHVLRREAERDREVIAEVALALATHRQVDGDHQRLVTCALGAPDHVFEVSAVAQHVGLKPEPARRLTRYFFNGRRARARQRVRHTDRRRGLGDGHVGTGPAEAWRARGRNGQRQRCGCAQQLRRGVHLLHVHQHTRAQPATLEGIAVAAQRGLVFGAAVVEVEQRARQTLLRHAAQVGDRIGLAHV